MCLQCWMIMRKLAGNTSMEMCLGFHRTRTSSAPLWALELRYLAHLSCYPNVQMLEKLHVHACFCISLRKQPSVCASTLPSHCVQRQPSDLFITPNHQSQIPPAPHLPAANPHPLPPGLPPAPSTPMTLQLLIGMHIIPSPLSPGWWSLQSGRC